jgi:hypothetical protein
MISELEIIKAQKYKSVFVRAQRYEAAAELEQFIQNAKTNRLIDQKLQARVTELFQIAERCYLTKTD